MTAPDQGDSISVLQQRLRTLLAGLHHPPLGSIAALLEEAGEASKHLVDHHCYGKALDATAFGDELADLFICIAELATLHGVDLSAAVRQKIEVVARKAPGWRAELGPKIGRAWREVHGPGATNPDASAPDAP